MANVYKFARNCRKLLLKFRAKRRNVLETRHISNRGCGEYNIWCKQLANDWWTLCSKTYWHVQNFRIPKLVGMPKNIQHATQASILLNSDLNLWCTVLFYTTSLVLRRYPWRYSINVSSQIIQILTSLFKQTIHTFTPSMALIYQSKQRDQPRTRSPFPYSNEGWDEPWHDTNYPPVMKNGWLGNSL